MRNRKAWYTQFKTVSPTIVGIVINKNRGEFIIGLKEVLSIPSDSTEPSI